MMGFVMLVHGVIAAVLFLCSGGFGQTVSVTKTLSPGFVLSGMRVADLDGDGVAEIVAVGEGGQVRTFMKGDAGAVADEPRGALVLPDPQRSLLSLARLTAGPARTLVALGPRGIVAYPFAEGTFAVEGVALTPTRGRRAPGFRLRVGAPRFVPLCRDMNGDGRADVLVPIGEAVEIWLNAGASPESGSSALPQMRRAARMPVKVRRRFQTRADRLSDELESSFSIPPLRTMDLNGDGRGDLVVEDGRRRAYHLQKADGTIPVEPDVTIDLRVFRDTTPKGTIRPGRVLAGGDKQTMQSRDLNGDGIPDYVIAHRRKVWVFHGREGQGPQFTDPVQVLRSADDITTLALMDLQPDGHPDLVVVKIQVPSVGGILAGALGDLEVEFTAIGYASKGGDGFENKPRWKSDITVSFPSITAIMKNPYAIIRRFEEASQGFRSTLDADFDGDGKVDVAVLDEDARQLRLWLGSKNPVSDVAADPDALLRRVLFEDEKKDWNLDRIVELISQVAEADVGNRTGGRVPDVVIPLRAEGDGTIHEAAAGDVDGDGRAEFVVRYGVDGAAVLDVLAVQ